MPQADDLLLTAGRHSPLQTGCGGLRPQADLMVAYEEIWPIQRDTLFACSCVQVTLTRIDPAREKVA